MGYSDKIIIPFYKQRIIEKYPSALLGYSNNNVFSGDTYDISIGNWNINSDWELGKKYNTIICTRCAYFAKNPEAFIKKCYDHLNDSGTLYVDWTIGDFWRINGFQVGFIKNNKQKWAYNENNYLWSILWDKKLIENEQCKIFIDNIEKLGYSRDLDKIINEEMPIILKKSYLEGYFNASYEIFTITKPYLQMYIFVKGIKNGNSK